MQITSKFTIAVHIISCIDYFKDTETVTSKFLAGSIGVNQVIVRTVVGKLKKEGIIKSSQGKSGMTITRNLNQITFYDIYKAVDSVHDEGLFHFHEKPNMDCPVGRNIHNVMNERLSKVQEVMEDELKKVTLQSVVADIKEMYS